MYTYKGKAVELIRAARPDDRDWNGGSPLQVVIRDKQGHETVVLQSDVIDNRTPEQIAAEEKAVADKKALAEEAAAKAAADAEVAAEARDEEEARLAHAAKVEAGLAPKEKEEKAADTGPATVPPSSMSSPAGGPAAAGGPKP